MYSLLWRSPELWRWDSVSQCSMPSTPEPDKSSPNYLGMKRRWCPKVVSWWFYYHARPLLWLVVRKPAINQKPGP